MFRDADVRVMWQCSGILMSELCGSVQGCRFQSYVAVFRDADVRVMWQCSGMPMLEFM